MKRQALRTRYGHATRYTKWVVKRGIGSSGPRFLGSRGAWVEYPASKRFNSAAEATAFYERFHTGHNYGLFPVDDSLARR